MKICFRPIIAFVLLALTFGSASVYATAPGLIGYQGRLTDGAGLALNGNYSLTFNIYSLAVGGALLWTETQNPVVVNDGIFSVLLGSISPISPTLFDEANRFVGVQVNGGAELAPRKQIIAVAYSLRVATIDGATGGSVVGDSRFEGNVVIGTGDASGVRTFIAGSDNTASGNYSSVGGGLGNVASGNGSSIGGGSGNTASGDSSFVGGGNRNSATGTRSFIGAGRENLATGDYSQIGGGWLNYTASLYSTVGGGERDSAIGQWSTVAGGRNNDAVGGYSTIGGGTGNRASGTRSFIGGGVGNFADGFDAIVVGGEYCSTLVAGGFVGGGDQNSVSSSNSVVVGGFANKNSGVRSFIGGGSYNVIDGDSAFIGGGGNNIASGSASVVGGGHNQQALSPYAYIGGGRYNLVTSTAEGGAILGGSNNTVEGTYASILGGQVNTNEGNWSTILGGDNCQILDAFLNPVTHNLVFGSQVDGQGEDYRVHFFNAFAPGRFSVNRDFTDGGADYPIHVGTVNTNGNGARLTAAGVWTDASSRTFKENFVEIGGAELLDKISQLSLPHYNYKGTTEKHIGPMAEDFAALFNVGSVDENTGQIDPMYLSAKDVAGVALAGVKELTARNQALQDQVMLLLKRIEDLESNKK